MARISLVMPVCNTAQYLEDAVASILAQTFRDFELVCVDDGSTDASLAILQRLAAADPRMRVAERAHENAGAARNCGMDLSTGDYIAFVDSDDIYHPRYLQSLVDAAVAYSADVASCGSFEFPDGAEAVFPPPGAKGSKPFLWHNTEKDLFRRWRGWTGFRLLRRSVLVERSIRFPSLPVAEDVAFAFASLACAKMAVEIPDVLVARRRRASSSVETRSLYPAAYLNAMLECRRLLEKCAPEYPLDGLARYAAKMFYWYVRAMRRPETLKAARETLPGLKKEFPSAWWWRWYAFKSAIAGARRSPSAAVPIERNLQTDDCKSVCILVVTYNRIECLKRLVAAVRKNTPGTGLLVVDNASTDGTGEWLRENSIDCLSLPVNSGGAGGFAAGLAEVRRRGWKYVWMMDDDVLPLRGAVCSLLEYARRYDAVQPAKLDSCGRIWEFEGIVDERSLRRRCLPYAETFRSCDAVPCNATCFEGLFMNTALVDDVGLPNADFFIGFDDIYYGMRIARKSSLVYAKTPCLQKQFDKETFKIGARRIYSSSASGRFYHLRNFRRVMRIENLSWRAWLQFFREWTKGAVITLAVERDFKGFVRLVKAVKG